MEPLPKTTTAYHTAFAKLLAALNTAQAEAVAHLEGPMLAKRRTKDGDCQNSSDHCNGTRYGTNFL